MSKPASIGQDFAPALGVTAHSIRRYWPEVCALLTWIAAYALLARIPVWHDVVWQLWIARHLNAGVDLYGWLVETNPPLWFWMALPIELLAAATGLRGTTILVAAVFVLVGISLWLSAILSATWSARQRVLLYAGFLAATLAVSVGDFAQREHELLIVAIPYALVITRRAQGEQVSWQLALAVGLLATPMIALKHYFALVPVLLEAWLIWRQRRAWRPMRPETLTLAIGAILYAGAVLVWEPDYLTNTVPDLQMAYGGLRVPLLAIFINQMNFVLIVAAFYFWHFRRELSAASQASLVVSAAFVLSYYVQFKGWGYHASPVIGSLLLALFLHWAQRPTASAMQRSEMLTGALLLVLMVGPALQHGPYKNSFAQSADRLLHDVKPGMTAVALTTKAARMWPMIEEKGLNWPSRYYHFWMMPTFVQARTAGTSSTELEAYMTKVIRETAQDFACNPPDLIINDLDGLESATGLDRPVFDMQAFFMEEPSYAALMQSYQLREDLGFFSVYEKIAPLPAPSGPCPIGPTPRL